MEKYAKTDKIQRQAILETQNIAKFNFIHCIKVTFERFVIIYYNQITLQQKVVEREKINKI